jgi:hypothetical protein
LTNRKLFFKAISTLKVADNGILERLKAVDALYWAVMHNNLPASDLPIEAYDKDLPFKEVVNVCPYVARRTVSRDESIVLES